MKNTIFIYGSFKIMSAALKKNLISINLSSFDDHYSLFVSAKIYCTPDKLQAMQLIIVCQFIPIGRIKATGKLENH